MSPPIVKIDHHQIELSHPEKVMFPEIMATKKDLVDYYRKIAQVMLPHLKDHPLNMQRFPDGIDSNGFYELDYLRNSYAQTSVAPYALRPKPQAPVATPLDWDELGDESLTSQSYTIENIFRRLGQKDDPWKNIQRHSGSLEKARAQLPKL